LPDPSLREKNHGKNGTIDMGEISFRTLAFKISS